MNIVIIGAQASGKMTIGQELEKLSQATLIHNHETIDFVLRFIPDFTSDMIELNSRICFDIYDVFAKYGRDVIATALVDFNDPNQVGFLEIVQNIFHEQDRQVLFVELDASLEERLRRNKTENRLKHKPLKRHIDISESEILDTSERCRYTTDEIPSFIQHYYKINNTHLSAEEVAKLIFEKITELEKN